MATGTAGTPARALPFQAVHYFQFTANNSDTGISSGIGTGVYLPKGASILFTDVFVKTAFNGGGTNQLTVGFTANGTDVLVGTDVDLTAASKGTKSLHGMDAGKMSADQQIFYKYPGTSPTTGLAYVTIAFIVDNDINVGT